MPKASYHHGGFCSASPNYFLASSISLFATRKIKDRDTPPLHGLSLCIHQRFQLFECRKNEAGWCPESNCQGGCACGQQAGGGGERNSWESWWGLRAEWEELSEGNASQSLQQNPGAQEWGITFSTRHSPWQSVTLSLWLPLCSEPPNTARTVCHMIAEKDWVLKLNGQKCLFFSGDLYFIVNLLNPWRNVNELAENSMHWFMGVFFLFGWFLVFGVLLFFVFCFFSKKNLSNCWHLSLWQMGMCIIIWINSWFSRHVPEDLINKLLSSWRRALGILS